MKIATTIELTDEQLVAVGLLETGKIQRAKMQEVRSYVTEVAMASINAATMALVDGELLLATAVRQAADE